MYIMKKIGRIGSVILALTFIQQANAGPSPGLHMADNLVHADENSHYVIRSKQYYPPYYYGKDIVTELIEFSNWTSEVKRSCIMSHVIWKANKEYDGTLPAEYLEADESCTLAEFIGEGLGTQFPSMLSLERDLEYLYISDGGIWKDYHTEPTKLILPGDYMSNHLTQRFKHEIEDCKISQDNIGGCFLPIEQDHINNCTIGDTVFKMEWFFIQLYCYSNNSDEDAYSTLIPVSKKTWGTK